jgi:Domain of unknown function (DUF4440)
MNKLFIRLFVAFVAFSFGLVLTSLIKPVHRNERTVTVLTAMPMSDVALTEDELQIREIYREYGPAQARHDREFFERVETEDFTLTVGDLKMSREEDIRWMESQPTDKAYINRVDHLRVFENLAVAHGYLQVHEGNGDVRMWPFADVWVKRNGAWRIQSTTSQ